MQIQHASQGKVIATRRVSGEFSTYPEIPKVEKNLPLPKKLFINSPKFDDKNLVIVKSFVVIKKFQKQKKNFYLFIYRKD